MPCKTFALFVVVTIFLVLGATPSRADDFRLFPGLKPGFKFDPTLTVIGGSSFSTTRGGKALGTVGVGFDINCGAFQDPDNRIRTHISLTDTFGHGVNAQTFDLSIRYTLPVAKDVNLSLGPSVAAVNARLYDANNNRYSLLAGYGAAGGLEYRHGHAYAGIDAEYLDTSKHRETRLPTAKLLFVIGYHL